MFAYCGNNPINYSDHSGAAPAIIWGYLAASLVCGVSNAVPVVRNGGTFVEGLKAFGVGMVGGATGFGVAHLMKFTPQGAVFGRGVSTIICDIGTAWVLTGTVAEKDIVTVSVDFVMDTLFSTVSYYYTEGISQQIRYWIDPIIDGLVDNLESYLFFEDNSLSTNEVQRGNTFGGRTHYSHGIIRGLCYALY